jgi:hypothetical protein
MTISNEELLQKATLKLDSFGGPGEAPLTIEQADVFLRIAITPQAMLPVVRTVMSNANKWQESKIDFAARILRPGTEATRLADTSPATARVKPSTGIVEISTVLVRGEVPVSDEVFEDQVERAGFANTLTAMIAEGSGRDIEDLFVNGDTGNIDADGFLALQDGWVKLAGDVGAGATVIDATSLGQDYQSLFKEMLTSLPDKYKRNLTDLRYFAPRRLVELYTDILAARGTPLGDFMLEGTRTLRYQGIEIVAVPLLTITPASPDTSHVLLTNRLNCYAGYRRQIKLETWRDPREGAMSFIVTARVNSQIAHVPATILAENVDVEP